MAVALFTVFVVVLVVMIMAVALLFVLVLMVVSAAALPVMMVVLVVMVVMMVTEMAVLINHGCQTLMVVTGAVGIVALLVIVMVVMAGALWVIAFLSVLVDMVMVMVVSLEGFLVDEVIETRIVDGVEHLVGEVVFVDVEDSAHEVELDLVRAVHGPVVLDTVVHVDEVEGYSLSVLDVDCGFDMSQKAAGFTLNVFSDVHEGGGQLLFCISVEIEDAAGESCSAATCLLHGVLFVSAHCINS